MNTDTIEWDAHACGWRIDQLPDGRACWVIPFLYTHAIVIGQPEAGYYDDRWCYATKALALAAVAAWNPVAEPEPSGWHRHPASGRRRAGGNPELEVIAQ